MKTKIGVIHDNKINKWALQRFEPLKDKFDITVFVGERNDYDVSSINMNLKLLTHKEETILALKKPMTAYKRVIMSPYKRMDYYYFSLSKYLKGFDLVFSSDICRSSYTLSSLKDSLGFKLVLAWFENIPFRAIFDEKTTLQKKLVMKKVDKFLPYTETAKEALRIEGVSANKIEVIYPGVDLERFKPGSRPEEFMIRNNIPIDSFVVLYVGKLVSWKGIHNLVYSAKILMEKGIINFVFAVAGKGAQKENLVKLIDETNTEKHFRFLDFVSYDEIPNIFNMADILILPSYPTMTWQEQFGMVLAEAMASGIPIISTLSGSIPEVLDEAGVLLPSGDYQGIASAIERLLEDKPLREKLSKKGRNRVEKLFCSIKVSEKLLHVIENIKCT